MSENESFTQYYDTKTEKLSTTKSDPWLLYVIDRPDDNDDIIVLLYLNYTYCFISIRSISFHFILPWFCLTNRPLKTNFVQQFNSSVLSMYSFFSSLWNIYSVTSGLWPILQVLSFLRNFVERLHLQCSTTTYSASSCQRSFQVTQHCRHWRLILIRYFNPLYCHGDCFHLPCKVCTDSSGSSIIPRLKVVNFFFHKSVCVTFVFPCWCE